VGYALDLIKDAFAQRAYLGLLAGYPQNGPNGETAPADALAEMGRDRRVIRGIAETDAAYAARLVTWLTDRRTAGNPYTLMRVLHAYVGTAHGVSFRTVDNRGNWYSRSATGVETSSLNTGNWNWDGDTSKWARFWVIVYPGTLWTAEPGTWGDGTWGAVDDGTIGLSITPDQAATMRALLNDWKPAGTRGQFIIALAGGTFDPTAPEPDGLWGSWHKSTSPAVASRLASARYMDGT